MCTPLVHSGLVHEVAVFTLPEVVVFATAHFEEWCASSPLFPLYFFFAQGRKKKSFFPSLSVLFLSHGSVDCNFHICFCWCYVEIVSVEGLRVWKSFICVGSAAIFLQHG